MKNNTVEVVPRTQPLAMRDESEVSGAAPPDATKGSGNSVLVPISILLSGLGVVVTAIIYFVGVQYHAAYFGYFRIDADRFPRDQTQMMLYGINAIRKFCVEITGNEWLAFTVIFVSVVATFGLYAMLAKLAKWSIVALQRKWPDRTRRWGRAAITHGILPSAIAYLVFAVPFLTGLLITVPAAIGAWAGRDRAIEMDRFFQECANALPQSERYAQVRDGATIKAQGFIVASAPDRIALMDRGVAMEYPTKDYQVDYMSGNPNPRLPRVDRFAGRGHSDPKWCGE